MISIVKMKIKPLVAGISRLSPTFLNPFFLWFAAKYVNLKYERSYRLGYKQLQGASQDDFLYPLARFFALLQKIPDSTELLQNLFHRQPQGELLQHALWNFLMGYEMEKAAAQSWHQKDVPGIEEQKAMITYLAAHLNGPLALLYGWSNLSPESQDKIAAERIISFIKDIDGTVLDLGCAHNPLVDYYKTKQNFVGYDYSFLSLRIGEVVDPANKGHFICGDIHDLPFQDGTFDVCIASHVLEHVAVLEDAIAEITRVLRPGGAAIVALPIHMLDLGAGSMSEKEIAKLQADHRGNFYAYDALVEAFEAHHLTVEEVKWNPYCIFKLRLDGEMSASSDAPRFVNIREILCCPVCKGSLEIQEENLACRQCHRDYPVKEGIPIMLKEELRPEFLKDEGSGIAK